jgi:hypothetical protein
MFATSTVYRVEESRRRKPSRKVSIEGVMLVPYIQIQLLDRCILFASQGGTALTMAEHSWPVIFPTAIRIKVVVRCG